MQLAGWGILEGHSLEDEVDHMISQTAWFNTKDPNTLKSSS